MRPRTISNEELLQATWRAVSREGPVRLTLAHVAKEAGVVPATLMQRFGSKRELLLALVRQGAGEEYSLDALRAAHPSPRATLLAYADCMAGMAKSPGELANHLGFLIMDLTDPDFHALTLEQSRSSLAYLKKWFDEAVAAKELRPCDSTRLARLFSELLHGALVTWAILREGDAQRWVRREMEAFLQPYETPRKKPRRAGSVSDRRSHTNPKR
jgi:AcrR family transcriptional regulator